MHKPFSRPLSADRGWSGGRLGGQARMLSLRRACPQRADPARWLPMARAACDVRPVRLPLCPIFYSTRCPLDMTDSQPALPPYRFAVPAHWCDYNHHFNDGYYLVAFSVAADIVLEAVGLGPRYRSEGHFSAYTVEAHIRYLREAKLGDELTITHAVQRFDAKRLWLYHKMCRADTVLATCEFVSLHVDARVPKAAPFPPPVLERIARLKQIAGGEAAPSAACEKPAGSEN